MTYSTRPNPTSFSIPSDHPAFTGHFPGNPILPGVTILDIVARTLGKPLAGFRRVKFLSPVRPGEVLLVELTHGSKGDQTFTIHVRDRIVCEGQLTLEPTDE